MNFFKRALASVTRKTGKSIILFAVVFVLGNVIAGAISIQQATVSVEKNIKSQLGANATFSFDSKAADKISQESPDDMTAFNPPSIDVIKQIGALPYVKKFDYNVSSYAETSKLKNYEDPEQNGGRMGMAGKYFFSLRGVNDPEIYDITLKKIALKTGRVFTKDEVETGKQVAVISQQVATENNLNVGDKMVVDYTMGDYNDQGSESQDDSDEATKPKDEVTKDFAYEVIGIFEVVAPKEKEGKKNQNSMIFDDGQINTIYMPNTTVLNNQKDFQKIAQEKFPDQFPDPAEAEGMNDYYTAIYTLKNPEEVEAFREEAQPLIQGKIYKILASTDKYDSIAAPVKSMSKIAKYVIIIAVLATLLIISLVVLLFLRDRKHELGIYLSLGEKRGKVLSQVLIEVLLIGFVAITLSVFTGNFLAKSVSSSLIETQLNTQAEDSMNNYGMNNEYEFSQIGTTDIDESDISKGYKISLTPTYVAIFYVVGLGTILLSTVIPLIYILRLNPKKIMM